MEDFVGRVLKRANLSEEELSECASVNLPEAAREFLDLAPAEIVAAVRAGDVKTLAESKTVWLSGWETHRKLRGLLAAVRGLLNRQADHQPSAGWFYRESAGQIARFGRIRHAQLLSRSDPTGKEPLTCSAQRAALRLRGKLKTHPAPVRGLESLRKRLSEHDHESE